MMMTITTIMTSTSLEVLNLPLYCVNLFAFFLWEKWFLVGRSTLLFFFFCQFQVSSRPFSDLLFILLF